MIFKVKKALQLIAILSSVILSNAVEITKEELDSFSYGASPFKLAIIGDSANGKDASDVMKLASYDALLHLGDFDYHKKPDAYFDNILTSSRKYKFMGVLGNHDSTSEYTESQARHFREGIYKEMKSTSRNSGVDCEFSDSKFMWSCKYKNMRIIGLTPDIKGADDRSKQLSFLKKHLGSATEDWKICAWHLYDKYYHTGKYPNDGNLVSGDGESFYDYCKDHGAIIFSAHDHVYARTKLMSKFSSPHIDKYDNKEYVKKRGDIVQIRKGATINILNGVGGYDMYNEYGEHKNYPHWQITYARGDNHENENKFGGLFCTFNVGGNNKKAKCEFLRINTSNKLYDNFTIYQNENPGSVSYVDIDNNFMNEKKKQYMKSKGIIEQPVALNTTDANTITNTTVTTNTAIVPDNVNFDNIKSKNVPVDSTENPKSKKTIIIIGASAGVVALAAVSLIALKKKKTNHTVNEPHLVTKLSRDEFNYGNQVYANENKSVVDDDFVALPMPSYNNNYQMQNNHQKYN